MQLLPKPRRELSTSIRHNLLWYPMQTNNPGYIQLCQSCSRISVHVMLVVLSLFVRRLILLVGVLWDLCLQWHHSSLSYLINVVFSFQRRNQRRRTKSKFFSFSQYPSCHLALLLVRSSLPSRHPITRPCESLINTICLKASEENTNPDYLFFLTSVLLSCCLYEFSLSYPSFLLPDFADLSLRPPTQSNQCKWRRPDQNSLLFSIIIVFSCHNLDGISSPDLSSLSAALANLGTRFCLRG